MLFLEIPLIQIQTFFFIFLRTGALLMSLPVFSHRSVPGHVRICLALGVAFILFPLLPETPFPSGLIPFAAGVAGEILLGICIGLSINLVFSGFSLAGQLAGFQMGFAIAEVIDPVTGDQGSVTAQALNLFSLLLFLALDAHLMLVRAMMDAFTLIPPFGVFFSDKAAGQMITVFGNLFVVALKAGAPVIAVLLLTTAVLGVTARTVPQMNVFFVAMPGKILVGLLFLGLSLEWIADYMEQVFHDMIRSVVFLMSALSG